MVERDQQEVGVTREDIQKRDLKKKLGVHQDFEGNQGGTDTTWTEGRMETHQKRLKEKNS